MAGPIRTYATDRIAVRWDSARCIHTARCIEALPEVFDAGRRPWIDPAAADADALARAVERCPTGALRYARRDGAPQEAPVRPAVAVPVPDGPLVVTGDLHVQDGEGAPIAAEHRLALCRCGATGNAPFCDGSHATSGFRSSVFTTRQGRPEAPAPEAAAGAPPEPTTITATHGGALQVGGRLVVRAPDGRLLADATSVWLCRCGRSATKPFCDGSHRAGVRRAAPAQDPGRGRAETPAALRPNHHVPPPPEGEEGAP